MKVLRKRISMPLLLMIGILIVSPSYGQGWTHYSLPGGTLTNLTWNPHDTTDILGYHPFEHKLFRSSDGGRNWHTTCDNLPPDPYNNPRLRYFNSTPDTLYFSEAHRLYRSVDSGESWTSILPSGTQQLTHFQVSESRPSRLIAHCWSNSGSPWLGSEDYGSTWQPIEIPYEASMLRIDPFDADHWIALDGDRLVETINAGELWRPYRVLFGDQDWGSIADIQFDPARQDVLYSFWQASDGTRSLLRSTITPNPSYALIIEASEFTIDVSGTLTARAHISDVPGDTSSFISYDAGESWNEVALWAPFSGVDGRHPTRSTHLTPNPLDPHTLLVSSSSNLFLSRDGGYSMDFVAYGIEEPSIARLRRSESRAHVITTNGQLWKLDHDDTNQSALLWNFVDDVWVGGGWDRTIIATGLGVRLSLDGGETFDQVLPTPYVNDTHSVKMSGQPPRIMVDVYGRLNMSINYGETWTQSSDPVLPGNIRLVSGGVTGLLAIRGSEIYQTTDDGIRWEFLGDAGVDIASVGSTALAEMMYLLGTDNRVYLFNYATGDLQDIPVPEAFGPVHDIARRQGDSQLLYIATDAGVYASYNLGHSWIPFEGNYHGAATSIDFFSTHTVFIATRNHGSWIGHDVNFVSVGDDPQNDLPVTITLYPAWPNPFNASTRIAYDLPQAGAVQLAVYDLLGRQVALLDQGVRQEGRHEVFWKANAASGAYIVRLQSEGVDRVQKVMLVR